MGKRRSKQNVNRQSQDLGTAVNENGEIEDIDAFVSQKLVVESGRDTEGRPIFAFYAFRFPDPAKQNYDELLEYLFGKLTLSLYRACFRRLDEFVRNDYVIVFFAEPLLHSPALGWMIDAYKKLSREYPHDVTNKCSYKKNVQKLYLLHSSWWFKLVLGFMQKVVSSKFAAKIHILEKLSELPDLVPCDNILIPQEILEYLLYVV